METRSQQCFLYRHFNLYGKLLYVGISLSAIGRLKQHSQSSEWFGDIYKVTIEKFSSRSEAEEAEIIAIRNEVPRHNIQISHDPKKKPKWKGDWAFDMNGTRRDDIYPKWRKWILRNYSQRTLDRIEERNAERLRFVENYNTDYPSDDGKFHSVNALY